jgi:hypothetical protein
MFENKPPLNGPDSKSSSKRAGPVHMPAAYTTAAAPFLSTAKTATIYLQIVGRGSAAE